MAETGSRSEAWAVVGKSASRSFFRSEAQLFDLNVHTKRKKQAKQGVTPKHFPTPFLLHQSVFGRIGGEVLYRKGGATTTGALRLWIVEDGKRTPNHFLHKVDGGALDEVQTGRIHHDLGSIPLEKSVLWRHRRLLHLKNVLKARASPALDADPQRQLVVIGRTLELPYALGARLGNDKPVAQLQQSARRPDRIPPNSSTSTTRPFLHQPSYLKHPISKFEVFRCRKKERIKITINQFR